MRAIVFAFERANAIIAKLIIMCAPKPHKLEIQALQRTKQMTTSAINRKIDPYEHRS